MAWKQSSTKRMILGILSVLLIFSSPYFSLAEPNSNSDNVDFDVNKIQGMNEDFSKGEASDIVETNVGPIVGISTKTADNKDLNIYYGIPYAVPPVGELRFQPPRKIQPHKDLMKALKPSLMCYQQIPDVSLLGPMRAFVRRPWSEDCLTLNIWTANPKPQAAPVLLYIHGGGFIVGSSTMMVDGGTLASEGVIVVSINYRLGVFGFLNLGDSEAPGNVGLMDQNLALRWVKENIQAFGGDPESITILGASAGSASVGFHLLSPMSKGLFKRAIMMGGSPTNSWASIENEASIKKAKSLLEGLGCPTANTTLALSCLREKDPEDILDGSNSKMLLHDQFLPTIDGDFLIEHPSVSVASGRFNPGDVLVGTALKEGGVFFSLGNSKLIKTKDALLFRRNFLQAIQNLRPGLSDLQLETLNIVYTNWENPDDPLMLRDAAVDLYGDGLMVCHSNEFAESLNKAGNSVYRYVYNHKLTLFFHVMATDWGGAGHGDDAMPVLGPAPFLSQLSLEDKLVINRFRTHCISFIKHGDPNLQKDEYPNEAHWPTFHSGHYILFERNSSIRSGLRSRECAVWLHLLPLLTDQNKC